MEVIKERVGRRRQASGAVSPGGIADRRARRTPRASRVFHWGRQGSRIRAVSRGDMPDSIIRSPFACDKFVDSANPARLSEVRKCPRSPVSDTAVRSWLTTCMFIDVA